jgi:hypothetical protein
VILPLQENPLMSSDGDDCPVAEELIGKLYASDKHGIDNIVSGLSPSQRGLLAMFCYGRAHLREVGLAVAATCDFESLVVAGGRAGQFLFDLSRERPIVAERVFPGSRRAKITLAKMSSSYSSSDLMPVPAN